MVVEDAKRNLAFASFSGEGRSDRRDRETVRFPSGHPRRAIYSSPGRSMRRGERNALWNYLPESVAKPRLSGAYPVLARDCSSGVPSSGYEVVPPRRKAISRGPAKPSNKQAGTPASP
jgi:hypothetical protein